MSAGGPTPFTAAGVPSDEFAALLEKGRNVGFLTPDDLMTVLERVELSEELLDAVRGGGAEQGPPGGGGGARPGGAPRGGGGGGAGRGEPVAPRRPAGGGRSGA